MMLQFQFNDRVALSSCNRPEIMADYHLMIKKDWSLKDMNRASQDEYLVGIYNSEFCHKLHEQPAIQVSDVPAD